MASGIVESSSQDSSQQSQQQQQGQGAGRSKLVQRWLATQPGLIVLHGARYSPHDNPTERIWGSLKAWLANSPTLTIQGRVRQAHAFFRDRSPAQLLATAAPWSSPWLPQGYGQDFWASA